MYKGSCTEVRIYGRWARCTLYDPGRLHEFQVKQAALRFQGYYVNPVTETTFITNALVPFKKAPTTIQLQIEELCTMINRLWYKIDPQHRLLDTQTSFWICFYLAISDLPEYIKNYFRWASTQGFCLDVDINNILYDPKANRLVLHDFLYQE